VRLHRKKIKTLFVFGESVPYTYVGWTTRFARLTLVHVKSTWNYNNGQMDDIDLPPYIRDTLDKEKQEKKPPNPDNSGFAFL
jgi:hypothetical protein